LNDRLYRTDFLLDALAEIAMVALLSFPPRHFALCRLRAALRLRVDPLFFPLVPRPECFHAGLPFFFG